MQLVVRPSYNSQCAVLRARLSDTTHTSTTFVCFLQSCLTKSVSSASRHRLCSGGEVLFGTVVVSSSCHFVERNKLLKTHSGCRGDPLYPMFRAFFWCSGPPWDRSPGQIRFTLGCWSQGGPGTPKKGSERLKRDRG